MENSFSLEFNPLTNVKAVKDYEEEIQKLKREVFELKTHIAHASTHPAADNLPKMLYQQNERLSQVQREKEEALKGAEEIKEMLAQTNQAKLLLENKYSQDIFACNEKIALLEDENKRLILRLEKTNKMLQEVKALQDAHQEAETRAENYKNFIQNLESQLEQTKYDFNMQAQEYEARIEEMRQQTQNEDSNKRFELENYKSRLDAEIDKNRDNGLVIEDLKRTVTREIEQRNRLIEEKNSALSNGAKTLEEARRRYETFITRLRKENEGFSAGLDKFKAIIAKKLQGILGDLSQASDRLTTLQNSTLVSEENRKFLEKLKIRETSIGGLIAGFKRVVAELLRRNELSKKEAADATFFAENSQRTFESKTVALLEEFHKQFNEAKQELLVCQKYLIKKSEETKALKNENARLIKQVGLKHLPQDANMYYKPSTNIAHKIV